MKCRTLFFAGENSRGSGRGTQRRAHTGDPGGNVLYFSKKMLIKHLRRQVVFDENNGALVLISGKLDIQDSLKDEKYVVRKKETKLII